MVHSKNKGSAFERKVRDLLRERGYEARRGQQFKGTPDSQDVECKELSWLNIECKACEKFLIYDWINQAVKDSSPDQKPIVVFKRNKKDILVTLRVGDFLDIIDEVMNGREKDNGSTRRYGLGLGGEASGGSIPGEVEGDRGSSQRDSDLL